MSVLAAAGGVFVILLVLWDTFETILLPRRVSGQGRPSRLVLDSLWVAWSTLARGIRGRAPRENALALYAILSLLALLCVWAGGLILGFTLLQWSAGSHLSGAVGPVAFLTDLYLSGTTFFTLGLGDVAPATRFGRALTVIEAGTGFGFLAMVLSYLPVLYQAFSRRESRITVLDEWAGSPPSAAVLLRRGAEAGGADVLGPFFHDWEVWSAELLESHLSYPILAFFRSQHDNQSWVASLTAVLDACALVIAGVDGVPPFRARLTFAIARHAVVDLTQALRLRPRPPQAPRLPAEDLARLRAWLAAAGVRLAEGAEAERRLTELREMYEPYVESLSHHLLMPLPGWLPPEKARFNWQTTAWARTGRSDAH